MNSNGNIWNSIQLNRKRVTLYRAEFLDTAGSIILSDNINNYDWIEFNYLSAIDGYGLHQGKIRSGHDSTISLTASNFGYVARMQLKMAGNKVAILNNLRYKTSTQEVQQINNIIIIEVNGIRN